MAKISDEEAQHFYGVHTDHEKMTTNGELRFRLRSPNGNSYIRTIASKDGGWQASHYHEQLIETYVIERRWIVVAEWRDNSLSLKRYSAGQCFSTEPNIHHNIYMPADAIISTVKHGASFESDWHGAPGLDQLTTQLSEEKLLEKVLDKKGPPEQENLDRRYSAYMSLYSNLDTLLWKIPAFAIAILSLFFLLIGRGASSTVPTVTQFTIFSSKALFAVVAFVPSFLLLLAAYSMRTIRLHHTMMGNHLADLEKSGYFHDRKVFLATRIPAPKLLSFFITTLGLIVLVFAILNLIATLAPTSSIAKLIENIP